MAVGLFFGLALIFLIIGIPIAVTVGLSSIIFIFIQGMDPQIAIQRLFAGVDVTALLAIPFFILAGDLMGKGGIASRLVRLANKGFGKIHGGLAIVSIVVCMFFAAISGSGVATVAAIGGIMIPGMVNAGYDKGFAAAVISTAAPIGVIIPPSISFVQFAVLAGVSIADLYKVGLPAGILVGLSLCITSYILSKKRGYKGTGQAISSTATSSEMAMTSDEKYTSKDLLQVLWALGTPFIIVGGVFAGVFTPTESAVVAVVYALLVGVFVFKELKVADLKGIFKSSAVGAARIMFIIANATLFSWVMTYAGIPQMIMSGLLAITENKILLLLLINVILLIAGTFMETGSIILIATPLLLPIIKFLGVDLVHFGIMLTVNTAIGLTTPPFGVCIFTTADISKLSVQAISKDLLWFILAMIVALFIIVFFPQTVMFML